MCSIQKSINSNSKKGKLLYESVTDSYALNSTKRQKELFVAGIVYIICGFCGIAIFTSLFFTRSLNANEIYIIVIMNTLLLWFIILCIIMIRKISFSKDQIYENGVSAFNHLISDYFKNNTFHMYSDITKIGWGHGIDRYGKKKPFRFIAIYKDNEERHTTTFDDERNINDFFDRLIETLKIKCPNAQWVEVDWETLPMPK